MLLDENEYVKVSWRSPVHTSFTFFRYAHAGSVFYASGNCNHNLLPVDCATLAVTFLAKFFVLNFVKGKKVHLHLHGGGIMTLAYTFKVSMLVILLIVILGAFDEHSYEFIHAGFAATSAGVGLLVLAAYIIGYVRPEYDSPIGQILYDRVYVMALNDFIVPKIGWAIAWICDAFNRFVDFIAHRAIPGLFEICSNGIRAIQSGSLERYVKIVVGLILVVLLIASVMGW